MLHRLFHLGFAGLPSISAMVFMNAAIVRGRQGTVAWRVSETERGDGLQDHRGPRIRQYPNGLPSSLVPERGRGLSWERPVWRNHKCADRFWPAAIS